MRMVMHRSPVVVFKPGTSIAVALHRGAELPDDDVLCTDPSFAWLFQNEPEPVDVKAVRLDGTPVEVVAPDAVLDDEDEEPPIERGTRRPGEQRRTRRTRSAVEPGE